MSELWFKIGLSAILGCLSLTIVGFGIYMIASADDWMDRLSGVFVILLGILAGWFLIPCIYMGTCTLEKICSTPIKMHTMSAWM